jgi:hypothetical protein
VLVVVEAVDCMDAEETAGDDCIGVEAGAGVDIDIGAVVDVADSNEDRREEGIDGEKDH